LEIASNPDCEVTPNPDHEVIIIEKNTEEESEHLSVKLLFGFQTLQAFQKEIVPEPYCFLQKFDFETFQYIMNYEQLNSDKMAELLTVSNNN